MDHPERCRLWAKSRHPTPQKSAALHWGSALLLRNESKDHVFYTYLASGDWGLVIEKGEKGAQLGGVVKECTK